MTIEGGGQVGSCQSLDYELNVDQGRWGAGLGLLIGAAWMC
jgi:hypothetical protein